MNPYETALTRRRIGELEEEIRKLRERVAVLESQRSPTPAPVFVPPQPQTGDPYAPPWTVTCGAKP